MDIPAAGLIMFSSQLPPPPQAVMYKYRPVDIVTGGKDISDEAIEIKWHEDYETRN